MYSQVALVEGFLKAIPTMATKSWEDYEKECTAQGAHLASIHSGYENSFVYGWL